MPAAGQDARHVVLRQAHGPQERWDFWDCPGAVPAEQLLPLAPLLEQGPPAGGGRSGLDVLQLDRGLHPGEAQDAEARARAGAGQAAAAEAEDDGVREADGGEPARREHDHDAGAADAHRGGGERGADAGRQLRQLPPADAAQVGKGNSKNVLD